MTPFFRASNLNSLSNFLSWRVCDQPITPSSSMKRGTIAEQVAFRGTDEVAGEWSILPAKLPENPSTGKRYATWFAWQEATGIDPQAHNSVGADTWAQAMGAARTIRQFIKTLPDYRWQVPGELTLGLEAPTGFLPAISGTCDLLVLDEVFDIKVSVKSNEDELGEFYALQLSAYAHMNACVYAAIIQIFPINEEETVWHWRRIDIPIFTIYEIEERCADLLSAYHAASSAAIEKIDLSQPI